MVRFIMEISNVTWMPKAKIKNLERVEQPREKLLKYGPEKLTDVELLAILLRTGMEGKNVLEVARSVTKKFPGVALANATVSELTKIKGVGEVKALELVACFELGRRLLKDKQVALVLSPRAVWERMEDLRSSKKEHFVVFFLDTQNQLIKREVVSVGTLNASLIHPREVFEPAVKHVVSHIIVAHNHPAGSLEPSEEDLAVTHRLRDAGLVLGIQLLDHVIVTPTGYASLKEQNLL
ncbi:MAG: DNA repair protein RadC [Candidatus Doudnabacteria bacterium]|nr:DNA repair protein RadC [Candidatus Doudnabacteria bacterium]